MKKISLSEVKNGGLYLINGGHGYMYILVAKSVSGDYINYHKMMYSDKNKLFANHQVSTSESDIYEVDLKTLGLTSEDKPDFYGYRDGTIVSISESFKRVLISAKEDAEIYSLKKIGTKESVLKP